MAKRQTFGSVELHERLDPEDPEQREVMLRDDQFDEDLQAALVKQVVTTHTSVQKGPFVVKTKTYLNNRYAWVPIPKDWTQDQVRKAIAAGRIQRILGLRPDSVMTPGQRHNVLRQSTEEQRDEVLSSWKERHLAVDGETGEAIMYDGHPVYHRFEFFDHVVEDLDHRPADLVAIEEDLDVLDKITRPVEVEVEA